jgi:hypothetical protein
VVAPQSIGTRMAGTTNFNLGNLTDDPNFDFLKILSSFTNDNDFENLSSFLNNSENDSPYNASSFISAYTDLTSMCNSPLNNNINITSLNVQSLPSKFSELNFLHFSPKFSPRHYSFARNLASN